MSVKIKKILFSVMEKYSFTPIQIFATLPSHILTHFRGILWGSTTQSGAFLQSEKKEILSSIFFLKMWTENKIK